MIQQYLEGLIKEAQVKEASASLSLLSMDELSKLSGIKLGMSKCSSCGSDMAKTGAMWKCGSCGMSKHAQKPVPPALQQRAKAVKAVQDPKRPGAETPPPGVLKKGAAAAKPKRVELGAPEGGGMPLQVVHRTPLAPQTPSEYRGEQVGRRAGSIGGAALGGLGGGALGGVLTADALRPALQLGELSPEVLREMSLKTRLGALVGAPGIKGKLLRAALIAGGAGLGGLGGAALLGGAGRLAGGEIGQSIGGMGPTKTGSADMEKIAGNFIKLAEDFEKLSAPVRYTLELLDHFNGDVEKTAQAMLNDGLDEDTAVELLKAAWAPWDILKAGLGHSAKLFRGASGAGGGAAAGRAAANAFRQAGAAAFQGAGRHLGRVGETFRRSMAPTWAGGGGRGFLGSLGHTAAQHPRTAAAVTGGAGLMGGYGLSKLSAADGAHLLRVADAAGRLLAKVAQEPMIEGVPVSELQESIEEAKGREDPSARAKRWGIGGMLGGGLAGGGAGAAAGYGLSRLLGGKAQLPLMIGGGLLGGFGGGTAGGRIGAAHGREEGEADVLLQKLRAQKALQTGHGAGMTTGFRMGAERGFQAGGLVGFRAGLERARAAMEGGEGPGNPPQGR